MSYATSLLMAYPPPYGPSTLLSDDLVHRSSLGAYYEPNLPYRNGNHLLSDEFTLGHNPTTYHTPSYPNYRTSSITNWQRNIPAQTSYTSLNNVREYSESLGTTSNTNTASSMARSIDENNYNGPTNIFPNYQQSYNRLLNERDGSAQLTTIWSPTRTKLSTNDNKLPSAHRSIPKVSPTIEHKKSPVQELKDDTTPIPSPPPPILAKQENIIEPVQPSVDIQTWLNESKIETSKVEKSDEQVWSDKIDQLHTKQAQREKEKVKSLRALPNLNNKIDNKPRITSFQRKNDSYFDSLFDGNYFRKTSTNQQNYSLSYRRDQSNANSFNKPKTTIFPKYVSPRKPEPPSNSHVPTTNSPKKQAPKQNSVSSITPRENIHKDSDERFREALNKFRTDRAEQQQKEINESTAKRLNYGNYVRRSTKDGLLHNVIKPAPWSDFLDMKKGNAYTLTKEEKKDLYNQSRSYGERVRYRNFALHHGDETARSQPRSILPFPLPNQEVESIVETTSHEPVNEDDNDSKSLKRSDSPSTIKTTNKTYTKQEGTDNSSRTTKSTDRSNSTSRPSEDDVSDYESIRKQKKKYYYSSARTTTATEESDNDETSEQQSVRTKYRDTDEDLFTVREEKTMESFEGARYKKR